MKQYLGILPILAGIALAIVSIEDDFVNVGWAVDGELEDVTPELIEVDAEGEFFFRKDGRAWYFNEFE